MCGICGQYHFRYRTPVRKESIERMTGAMVHRGPDDAGLHLSGPLGLGFRRLSIIDIEGGHQPMSDPDESVWVVFNGEIYNFPELRKELEGRGYTFRSRSDTEVIVHGYREWGNDVLLHLNGMFGLAIWDERAKQLLLARDRMGIKLLYYTLEGGSLSFGSEIRSLLAVSDARPDVDPVSLNMFLRYRYTPSPSTLYRNIFKLAPGTRLVVKDGEAVCERWWNFKPEPFDPMPGVREAGEELLTLYRKAIRRQLISDVPLGLLLSGGLDSGLLLALMNLNGDAWRTFTVGYGESFKDDELALAKETARVMHAPNESVLLSRDVFEESLPRIIASLEEPVASSSIVPMYHVCERARSQVKVALMGQGPDELFGGYKRHLGVHYGGAWRGLPAPLTRGLGRLLSPLPRSETLKRGLYSLGIQDRMHRYQNVFSILPGDRIDALFRPGLLPAHAGDTILDCWAGLEALMRDTDELGGLQFLEVRSSLPDELLMYADKLSMAHSLEVRVPFLDQEIVEYVERLDASFKVHHGVRKRLHRNVCKRFLPPEIVKRKKAGFAVNVVDDWFQDSFSGKMEAIFLDPSSRMYSFLNPDTVQALYGQHRSRRQDNHKILFSLIVFEVWMRTMDPA